MNLFDVIFKNASSKEVIFSSVFNYLIDANETHGLKYLFINRIIESLQGLEYKEDYIIRDNTYNTKVFPEKPLIYDMKPVGSIDSFIEIEVTENKKSFIATEVKIIDESARNICSQNYKQTTRYYNALHQDAAISGSFIFIFLVPSTDSKICIEEFGELNNKENAFLLYWKKTKENDEPSIEAIIDRILMEEMKGVINPIPYETKYLLKSLRSFIRNDFNRSPSSSEKGIFPSRQEYISSLNDYHKELFEILETNLGKLSIRTNHTSIGIPYEKNPEPGLNNTLFRILTCKKYYKKATEKDTNIIKYLVFELNKKIYNDTQYLKSIEELFSNVAVVDHVGRHYHPNGKEDEPVIVITFEKKPKIKNKENEEFKKNITEFINQTKEKFKETERIQV